MDTGAGHNSRSGKHVVPPQKCCPSQSKRPSVSHRLSGSDCSATLSDNTVWQPCLAVQHFRAVQHCPPTLSGYYVWQCNTAVHGSQLSSVHCNELHCIALCCNRDFLISLEAFNPQQLQSIFCHFATERFCSVNIN